MFKSTIAILLTLASTSVFGNFLVAKETCIDRHGNLSIPFPFSTTENYYLNRNFSVTCHETYNPPKAFLQHSAMEITRISLDGQLRVLQFVARDCYLRNGNKVFHSTPYVSLPVYLTVNNTTNKFTIVGCDTYAFIHGRRKSRNYQIGCSSRCDSLADLVSGPCSGLSCCQMSIPEDILSVNVSLMSYDNLTNVWGFNNCSYGFLAEEREFGFSPGNLSSLRNVERLPMVVDWAIGNGTCEEAQKNMLSYACKSVNSNRYKPSNGYGYSYACSEGYQGNPYLPDGCQDVDECQDPKLSRCVKQCENTIGGYHCVCPKGYQGDGKRGGRGCIRNPSFILKLVAG